MPIYGYKCEKCGHEMEVLQSFSEARLTICPKCGGKLQKLFYPSGMIFKGSGFYSTDYKSSSRSGGNSDSSSESKTEAAKSDSKSDTSADSKSDSKSESKSDSKSDSGSQDPKAAAS